MSIFARTSGRGGTFGESIKIVWFLIVCLLEGHRRQHRRLISSPVHGRAVHHHTNTVHVPVLLPPAVQPSSLPPGSWTRTSTPRRRRIRRLSCRRSGGEAWSSTTRPGP